MLNIHFELNPIVLLVQVWLFYNSKNTKSNKLASPFKKKNTLLASSRVFVRAFYLTSLIAQCYTYCNFLQNLFIGAKNKLADGLDIR